MQLINLLLLIIGVVLAGIGLASWSDHPGAVLLLVTGLALVALAYISDRARAQRIERRRQVAVRQRIDALTAAKGDSSQTLKVHGGLRMLLGGLFLSILGMSVVTMASAGAMHDVVPLLAGIVIVPVGLLMLMRAWPAMGRPTLELDKAGFVTPWSGRIPWREVSGVCLNAVAQRNGGQSFTLSFRVRQFARVAPQIHWTDRLLAVFRLGPLARGVVAVPLLSPREPPQAVHALARQLWKQSTGRDYDWNPHQSDAYNEAMERSAALTTQLAELCAADAPLADPQKVEHAVAAMEADVAVIASAHRRAAKKQRWTLGLTVLLVVAVLAWPWIKRLLQF